MAHGQIKKKSVLKRIAIALFCAAIAALSIWALMPETLLWAYVGGGVGFVVGYILGDDAISMIASLF